MRGGAQFQSVVSAIQRLPKSQWLKHEGVLARELSLEGGPDYTPVDELDAFVKSIENGGSGTRYNNTFVSNPEPLDAKTNLTGLHQAEPSTTKLHSTYRQQSY